MLSLNRTLRKPSAYQSLGRLILLPTMLFSAFAPSIALDLPSICMTRRLTLDGTIVELIGANSPAQPEANYVINQVDIAFEPLLSVIPKSTSITLTNNDSFKHHVYSFSKGNQFDIPLYTDVPKQDVALQNSGIVKLGCNIHDWMIAYIYVHESQFLKKVNSSPVIFDGVLAGAYEVRVWNPRFRNTKRILKKVLTVADGWASTPGRRLPEILAQAVASTIRSLVTPLTWHRGWSRLAVGPTMPA